LDGQGHWIKNVSFDLEAFYDGADSGTVYIDLFPNIAVLENTGLEFAVEIKITAKDIYELCLGLASNYTQHPVLMHNIVANGSISLQEASEKIRHPRIGVCSASKTTKQRARPQHDILLRSQLSGERSVRRG